MCKRTIEPKIRGFEHGRRGPDQPLAVEGGVSRRRMVSGKEASLHLARPIVELGEHQIRVAGETTFRFALAVIVVIEEPKAGRQSTESSDQAELRPAELDDQAESHPLGKRETVFGFRLHFSERISDRETYGDQLIPAVRGESEIADPIRGIECATDQLTSAGGVLSPRLDHGTYGHVGASLITGQATLLDQVIAQLTEPKAGRVVVEARPGEHRQPDVRETRPRRSFRARG